jgi:RimJ/RimL family protein N-acetyltransferase
MEMYTVEQIFCKDILQSYFIKNIYLHLYEIGDLDDFFFPKTEWFGIRESDSNKLMFIILLYNGTDLPVLLAHGENITYGAELLDKLPNLPKQFFSHLSLGLSDTLLKRYGGEFHGKYLKMALTNKFLIESIDSSLAVQLTSCNMSSILNLYAVSYPNNWFDPRMVETGQLFGLWLSAISSLLDGQEDVVVAIAGIHVYSPSYNVAALGNIAVHCNYRNRGYGATVTAALIKNLLANSISFIGLNVDKSNESAIKCYMKLGFTIVGEYEEYMWKESSRSTSIMNINHEHSDTSASINIP